MKDARKERVLLTLAEEEKALKALQDVYDNGLAQALDILDKREGRILISGVGKSGFVAMKMAATFTSLGHQASFLHPVDALHGDSGMVGAGDVFIALSFSGESAEILKVTAHIKEAFNLPIISITGARASRLGRMSDAVIEIKIQKEGSPLDLAPMASVTASLVVGDMLASGLTSPEAFSHKKFATFHPAGSLGLKTTTVAERMWTGGRIPKILQTASLKDVITEITDKKRGITAVLDSHKNIVGVITDGDIRRFFLTHDSLKGFSAADAMTAKPKIIAADHSLQEALELMETSKIMTLFVTDSKKQLSGMIHMHEILENALGRA